MSQKWRVFSPQLQVVLTILILVVRFSQCQTCPSSCQCRPLEVVCKGGNLQETLSKLPQYSASVDISSAQYAFQIEHRYFNQCLAKGTIKELTLRQSQINKIAEAAFHDLNSLRQLNLSQNYINDIVDTAFSSQARIEELDLSENRLSSIQTSIQRLSSLKYLNLAYNRLREIRLGSFRYLTLLHTLILDGNQLTSLQGHTFQGLGNLRHLSLKGCSISFLPDGLFFIVRRLNVLNLQANWIQSIPSAQALRNLAYLQELYLDNNQISKLGDLQFGSIPIDKLSLSHNNIRTVSKNAFKYFNAKIMDMSFNQVSWIHPGTFQPLAPEVSHLNLAGNPLTEIHDGVFHGLYRLQVLNLSRCNIGSLPVEDFASLQTLRVLDISGNNLRNLSWPLINKMKSLTVVSIDQNPWHCDCSIQPLRQWLGDQANKQKLVCSRNRGRVIRSDNSPHCNQISCTSPSEKTKVLVEELADDQVEVCATDQANGGISLDNIVIIVCVIVITICATVSILVILWKKNCFKKLMKRKGRRDKQPPYYPYNSSEQSSVDLGSINESDRGFPLRAYLQALENMNGEFRDITPTDSRPHSVEHFNAGSDFAAETQSRTCSSLPSTIVVGRESAV